MMCIAAVVLVLGAASSPPTKYQHEMLSHMQF